MPGRDYTRAYALLEHSLGDTSYPTLSRTKRGKSNERHCSRPVSFLSYPSQTESGGRSPEEVQRLHFRTELFSPTPPQTSHQEDPSFGLARGWKSPDVSTSSEPSTPVNYGFALTPNTTPPSLGSRPQSKPLSYGNASSSQADSFRTAQEDFASNHEADSRMQLPLHGTVQPRQDDHGGLRNLGWGMDSLGQDGTPPIPAVDKFTAEDNNIGNITPPKSLSNVTIRRKRKHGNTPARNLTFFEDGPRAEVIDPEQESPHSWYDGSEDGESKGGVHDDTIGRASSDLDLARLRPMKSNKRKGTPIVEADILDKSDDTPPRQRALRHSHKNDALRDGSSEAGSPQPEQRPFSASADHSLHHKERSIFQTSDDGMPARSTTLPTSLHNSRNVSGHTAPTVPRSLSGRRSPSRLRPNTAIRRRHASIDAAMSSSPMPHELSDSGVYTHETHRSSIDEPLFPSSTELLPNLDRGGERNTPDRGGKVFPQELQYLAPLQSPNTLSPSTPGSTRRSADPHTGTHSSAMTFARTSPLSEGSEGLVLQDAQTMSIAMHNNKSLVVVEHPRSLQSRDQSEGFTKFEQETPESEQFNPTNWIELTRLEEETPVEELLVPTKPLTPRAITGANFTYTDSPLTNPRRPPEPPAFSISVVPPTPYQNGADAGNATSRVKRSPMRDTSRRSTLLHLARTYSDKVVQPIRRRSTRTNSSNREPTVPTQARNISAPTPTPEPRQQTQPQQRRPSTLHTHWQPRDFWDSVSDTSSFPSNSPQPPAGPADYAHAPTSYLETPADSSHGDEGTRSRPLSLLHRGRTVQRFFSSRASSLVRRTTAARPFSFASGVSSDKSGIRLHELGFTALPQPATASQAPPSSYPGRGASSMKRSGSAFGIGRRFSINEFLERVGSRGSGGRHSHSGAEDTLGGNDPHAQKGSVRLPGRLTQSLRTRMRERSQRREEKDRAEQRERLRDSIGMRIYRPE